MNPYLLSQILANNTFCCLTLLTALSTRPDHENIIVLPVNATPDFPQPRGGARGRTYSYSAGDALGYIDGWWCTGRPQFYGATSNVATTMNNTSLQIGLANELIQNYTDRNRICADRAAQDAGPPPPFECWCTLPVFSSDGGLIWVGPGCFITIPEHPRGWYCSGGPPGVPTCDEIFRTFSTNRTGDGCAANYYTGNCPNLTNQGALGSYSCSARREY